MAMGCSEVNRVAWKLPSGSGDLRVICLDETLLRPLKVDVEVGKE
jgi:hypothetical protein